MGYEDYNRLVRILLLMVVFLVAVQTVLALWSQVGGQSHLDMMFWGWKLGITLAAAALITWIAQEMRGGISNRRVLFLCSLLIAVIITAGLVTLYYHQNETTDDEQSDPQQTQLPSPRLPLRNHHTRQEFSPRVIGAPVLQPNAL